MPAPDRVNLSERKRRIVAEADQHRDAIGVEFRRVTARVDDAQDFFNKKKWLLWGGGVAVAGLMLLPKLRSTLGVVASIPALLRGLRR
jgi:hypothetical protein